MDSNEFSDAAAISYWSGVILKSLHQPESGFMCGSALHYVCRFIRSHDNWKIGMRKAYPDILDAMVALLLTTQKANGAEKIEREWSDCRLGHTKGSDDGGLIMLGLLHEKVPLHRRGSDKSATFDEVVAEICSFLQEIIDDISKPSDKIWPNSLETTLFPGGAKDAVLALRHWFIQVKDTGPLQLLCTLLCHFPVGSALDAALFDTPEFITAVVLEFKIVAEAGKIDPILNYGRFWRNFLAAIGTQQYSAFKEYLRPNSIALYESIAKAKAPSDPVKNTVDAVVHAHYMNISIFLVDIVPPPLGEDNVMFSPYSFIYPESVLKKQCIREGCPNASLATSAELQTCGGCRAVRYCSPKCQREAWKWRPAPHKLICKDLAQLAQIKKDVGGSKSRFEKVAREQFSPERAREIKLSAGMHERYQIDRVMAGEITMADC